MANYRAISAVGKAISTFLDLSFRADTSISAGTQVQFRVISSQDLATEDSQPFDKTLSLFLHRITVDEQVRPHARLLDVPGKKAVLSLDLHYLVTYWGSSADDEQTVLGWVMQTLQSNPILDSSLIDGQSQWGADETLQVVPANLSLEDIMRIWDAIAPKFRLSIAYTARPVRLDVADADGAPVIATRISYGLGVPS
jgi:hypothetical protein